MNRQDMDEISTALDHMARQIAIGLYDEAKSLAARPYPRTIDPGVDPRPLYGPPKPLAPPVALAEVIAAELHIPTDHPTVARLVDMLSDVCISHEGILGACVYAEDWDPIRADEWADWHPPLVPNA